MDLFVSWWVDRQPVPYFYFKVVQLAFVCGIVVVSEASCSVRLVLPGSHIMFRFPPGSVSPARRALFCGCAWYTSGKF